MKARAKCIPLSARTVTPTAPRVSEKTIRARREEEQLLLSSVFQILRGIGFGEDYDPSEKSAEGKSVEWLAIEVADRLDEIESSKLSQSPKPPSGAETFYKARHDIRDKLDALENSVRGTRATRAFQDCQDEVFRFTRATERLYLTVGFAIGIKAAARQFRSVSDTLDQSVGQQYAIASPAPTEKQLQMLDDLARDVQWNAGEYEKLLEQTGRARRYQNRDRCVAEVARLIRLKLHRVIA